METIMSAMLMPELFMSQLEMTPPIRNQIPQPDLPATVEYSCLTPGCSAGMWHVALLSAQKSLWRVSSETAGSYLIAGVRPACPWCGADL